MCWLHLCSLTAKSIHHLLPVSERIWKAVGALTIRFPLKGFPYPAPPSALYLLKSNVAGKQDFFLSPGVCACI